MRRRGIRGKIFMCQAPIRSGSDQLHRQREKNLVGQRGCTSVARNL